MDRIKFIPFLSLLFLLIGCAGGRQFEWIKLKAYDSAKVKTGQQSGKGPNTVDILVQLKEKNTGILYYAASDDFFEAHQVKINNNLNTTSRNNNTKKAYKKSDYIYNDEDIEENQLNRGLIRLQPKRSEVIDNQKLKKKQGQDDDNHFLLYESNREFFLIGFALFVLILGGFLLINRKMNKKLPNS
ncbi:hypothetical protein [Pseudopedobacter beijingensis]|uniref:Lipoprotein n=1 Tax=Pseudopedobacter beijingensis TaxID=1207056 RepID=A0ABW4I9A3_9SPHI